MATIGHIRELPKKDAIDPANDYAMTYVTIPGKEEAIKKITGALKDTDEIILATDPDREGEAIAWHVSDLLKTKHAKKIAGKEIKRAVFYEISKEAVNKAIAKPRRHSNGFGSITRNKESFGSAFWILDSHLSYGAFSQATTTLQDECKALR